MNAHTQTPPSLLKVALEARLVPELWAYSVSYPLLQRAPKGDGHPVMVFPGFLASDVSTVPLRTFLRSRGYTAYGWSQGRNFGRGIDTNEGVTRDTNVYSKLRYLHQKHGEKVSLIGWSLGGLYARELARLAPDCVRQVITLGSPFNGDRRANHAAGTFERMSGKQMGSFSAELIERVKTPPPVPSTAIYSRTDGIVCWECCREQKHPFAENIEVEGSHCGLGHNPAVLWIIAERLAQSRGTWQPFKREGLNKILTYDTGRTTPY